MDELRYLVRTTLRRDVNAFDDELWSIEDGQDNIFINEKWLFL